MCACEATTEEFEVATTVLFSARKCRSCRLVFTWPRPTPAELEALYTETYFTGGLVGPVGYEDYRSLGELNARRSWSALKRYGRLDDVHPRTVLDVGCATGGFLAEARADGWRGVGVEMSAAAAAVARDHLGLDVMHGDVFAPGLPSAGFGLVTMWHVLEHVTEPASTLERAADLLAPGGRLFLELPNWDSVGRTLKGPRWSQMKPPEHINFFTPRSLAGAVRRAGLTPLDVGTHYPSLWDRARARRAVNPLPLAAALLGSAASVVGRGGYLRLLARR